MAGKGFAAVISIVPGDVVGAMEALGINVLRVDDSGEAHAKCPAHVQRTGREDRKPSFSVNVDSGLFSCWSCRFKGDFVELVRWHMSEARGERVERAEAVAWIRRRGTIQRVERILAKPRQASEDTTKVINEAKLALFGIPPRWARRERRVSVEACQRYGVLWDPSRELWILPVRDEDGLLQGWQEKGDRYFNNRPKGLKKSRFVFGLWALPKKCEYIAVVESPLDSVWLGSLGIPAVATYGAHVSDAQMEILRKRTRRLVLFPDNDRAGHLAQAEILKRWTRRGMAILIVDYRKLLTHRDEIEGLDPGDLEDDEALLLVDEAIPSSIAALVFRRVS